MDTIVRSRCEKQSNVQLLEFERGRKLEYRERAEKEKNLRFDFIILKIIVLYFFTSAV